jgi:hypothetical protein
MRTTKFFKNRIKKALLGAFFVVLSLFTAVGTLAKPVHADPVSETQVTEQISVPATDEATTTETTEETAEAAPVIDQNASCKKQVGVAVGWIVCPIVELATDMTDFLYSAIKDVLVVTPISMDDSSSVYIVWRYFLGIANIVFIIFLLIVIYSQITGLGISNYGIKKALPKLIIAAVLVNLSYIICTLAIDVSNIAGESFRGLFDTVKESAIAAGAVNTDVGFGEMLATIIGGGGILIGGVAIAAVSGALWMLIPTVLAGLVSVAAGFLTLGIRQAVIVLLVMISPLAFVCYLLPNTEKLFKKWKDLFVQMLVFYPMFSILYGASALAGWAIIASAKSSFVVILGIAVQIVPLFLSVKLMKMSGSILGVVSDTVNRITSKPLATTTAWADRRRQQTYARNLQYGKGPYMSLQRYLDNRKALHENTTDSLRKIRQNSANLYVQRKISGGYKGAEAVEANKGNLRANKYTRIAKDLSNSNMASTTATLDTEHVLTNYNGYYTLENAKHSRIGARRNKIEVERGNLGAHNYLELSRAQMTHENDEEADFGYMVHNFLAAKDGINNGEEGMRNYRHYILSSAGGLGEVGTTRVLGKVIAKAAAVEASQRRDINIVASKYPPDKRNFRNMIVGYYVDDDGFATDKNGNKLGETYRGEFLEKCPERLIMWDTKDENGSYYDWYDNGTFVTRVYKKDKSTIKELLSNFDAPINDPINNLYGILSGIKEDPNNPLTGHIGLDAYRTTVARAILGAGFKEKNASFGPMVANMIASGYIQNYAQENLAYLDSFNKATKPGGFNTQDHDAVSMLANIMNPDNWEEAFPTEMIRGFRNVNGEPIYGIRYNADGKKEIIPAEKATREELMNRVKEKYIFPAARKMVLYMSRQTPNTVDSQKGSVVSDWKELKQVFDTKYGTEEVTEYNNPYRQEGDTRDMARDIQQRLYVLEKDGTKHYFRAANGGRRNSRGGEAGDHGYGTDHGYTIHRNAIEDLYVNSHNDPDAFARDVTEYLNSDPALARAAHDFTNYVVDNGFNVTVDELHDYAEELLNLYVLGTEY